MKRGCGSCGECIHGRGIICNHPVIRIMGTLTSISPFFTASKRGPSAILSNACTHISANKNVTKYVSHLVTKHHVGGGIAHFNLYVIKNIYKFLSLYLRIELGIHGKSADSRVF